MKLALRDMRVSRWRIVRQDVLNMFRRSLNRFVDAQVQLRWGGSETSLRVFGLGEYRSEDAYPCLRILYQRTPPRVAYA